MQLKTLSLLGALLCVTPAHSLTFKQRASYFFAPAIIAYGYNAITHTLYQRVVDPKTLNDMLWHQNPVLFFGVQGLTYYCWSQAFSQKKSKPEIHVTISQS